MQLNEEQLEALNPNNNNLKKPDTTFTVPDTFESGHWEDMSDEEYNLLQERKLEEKKREEEIQNEIEIDSDEGTVSKVVGDIGYGLTEVPRAILGGLESAINETASFLGDVENAIEDWTGAGRFVWSDDSWWPEYMSREEVKKLQAEGKIGLGNTIFEGIENADFISDEYETVTGGIAKNAATFVFGMIGAGKLTKLKSGKSFKNSMVNAAIADAVVFDPEMDNLSAFLNQQEWAKNTVTEYLATDMSDSRFENRLRNAAEGAIIGIPFELMVRGFRLAKLKQEAKANPEDKNLLKQIDEQENQIIRLAEGQEIKGHKPPEKQLTNAKNWMGKKKQIDLDKINYNTTVEAEQVKLAVKNKNSSAEGQALRIQLAKDFENNTEIPAHYYNDAGDLIFTNEKPMKANIVKKDKNGKEYIDEKEYRRLGTVLLKDPNRQTAVDDLIAAGQGARLTVDETVDQFLNVEALDQITALAKDFKEMSLQKGYEGIKWNPKARVIDNIFNMALSDQMDTKKLLTTLMDNGMTYNQFVLATVGSGSQAGKVLQKLSQVNRFANQKLKGLADDKAIKDSMDNLGDMHNFFLRVENIRRGAMVSSIATASRNLTSAFVRMPLEGIGNVLDNALYDLANGGAGKALYGLTRGQTWKDAFAHHSFLTAKDLKKFDDQFLGSADMKKWYDRMYGQMNEVRQLTGRKEKGAIGAGEMTMQRIENVVDFLNIPNRWQEFTIRRATMYGELQRQMRREWGQDFFGLMENGKLNAVKANDPSLRTNLNSKTFDELMESAANKALDITYAKQPNTPPLRDITTFMTKYGGTLIIPFPRFMFNSMELMGNYAFGASIPLTKRVMNTALGKNLEVMTELDRQRISRNMVGIATALDFMQYRETSESADYKMIPISERAEVDTTPQFPVRQFLWLGEALKRGKEGTFGEFWSWKEFSETFGGTNFRAGTGNVIMDEITSIIDQQDREAVSEEKFGKVAGELIGNYISSWAIPLGQLADMQRAFGLRQDAMKDYEQQDRGIISGFERFKAEAVEPIKRRGVFNLLDPSDESELPNKQYIFQEGETKDRIGTAFRAFGGFNIAERKSKEGQFFESLGLKGYLFDSESDIPSVRNAENKLMRAELPFLVEQLKLMEQNILEEEKEKDRIAKARGYDVGGGAAPSAEERTRLKLKIEAETLLKEAKKTAQDLAVPELKEERSAVLTLTAEYRKISSKKRKIGYYDFKAKFYREPNYMNAQDLVELIELSKQ